ncbi:MAG: FAD-dependent oxidoreductase [Lachnospiraceae bacterium]|nr:FAD-dependent oxidoreductase [Lachnospiraceae bacterium]
MKEAGWENCYNNYELSLVEERLCKLLHCKAEDIFQYDIVKRSIDARKKQEICYNYCVEVSLDKKREKRILEKGKQNQITTAKKIIYNPQITGGEILHNPPVIVGFGPAGMYCALMLARAGYCPVVIEQGSCVEKRRKDVENFWKGDLLKPFSNVQFGEGGAGTFSDGKLNTMVKDNTGRNHKVLEIFVEHGAPKEILYMQKPHIGTDLLCDIVRSIREEIIRLGGEVHFNSQVTNLQIDEQKNITGVEINHKTWLDTQIVVLAIGHSARETFSMLYERGISMEQKPFAIGVRIEHKQSMIDKAQYGELQDILPAADYKLTYQAENGRSAFSFCMCPGGFVVNASSEPEALVVNGMSNYKRDEENANSALVVNVVPEDFGSNHVLAGVEFQRKWERLAYETGKGKIPTQLWKDFLNKKESTEYGEIIPCQKGANCFGNLWNCLPKFVCETLQLSLPYFGKKISGYDREDSILSGVETRTSSPIRILRNGEFESNITGLYPCGEGAGYAGGITSAAMDGLRIYEAIIGKYKVAKVCE